MKINGRYGRFTPRTSQQPYYAKRAKREQRAQLEAAARLRDWLDKHNTCANGCGQPVAFYDTIHYTLRHSGCCSSECEAAWLARSEAN
ncbi:hypothetical protein [Cupriavidus pinatubonensis]|uniref:hypothetical protein n=1 Tax=Cupriavidus pinatubonensis TaxID=248026 RepID=UPI003618BAE9